MTNDIDPTLLAPQDHGPWNPRYVAFAKAHGRTAQQQMNHDDVAWRGGCMTGFILWISQQLCEAFAAGESFVVRNRGLGDLAIVDHDAWTAWLQHEGATRLQIQRQPEV